tara:strand:- start:7627 stop:7971 length:345 start_codon:yes stop_codon:yes gene_type:complete
MARGQTKRVQATVYHYLAEQNEAKHSNELADWYNSYRHPNPTHTKGQNHGTTAMRLGGIMAASLLFENVGFVNGYAYWEARPIDVVVERAIKSKTNPKKYPKFLRELIEERMLE